MKHKYWHSRGYLPHFDAPNIIQGITYRLADALPSHIVNLLQTDADRMSNPEMRSKIEQYLNAGYGACHLKRPEIAEIIEETFLLFDPDRYKLIAWVVMPNHVHALIEVNQGHPLHKTVQSWKSYTAGEANKILKQKGKFWYNDYFDRFIRDELHFYNAINYIHNNPVKAGLVKRPKDWPYSSARYL